METTTLDLQEGTTYKVVHLPLTLPIPFGVKDTTKGTVAKASLDTLDTTVKDGAFWVHCILDHDATRLGELICCTANGLGKIGNHLILPRLLAGQSWGSPSSCKVTVVDDNDKDEAKPAIDALASHLTKITDLSTHSTAMPASVDINLVTSMTLNWTALLHQHPAFPASPPLSAPTSHPRTSLSTIASTTVPSS